MPQVRPSVPGTKKMGEAQRSLFAELVSSPAMTQTPTGLLDGAFLALELKCRVFTQGLKSLRENLKTPGLDRTEVSKLSSQQPFALYQGTTSVVP